MGAFTNLIVVAAITAIALFSLVRGLDGGIRRLSEFNMALAATLGLFVLLVGPTMEILGQLPIYAWSYVEYLPQLSSWVGRTDDYYMHGWTTFYWAWWIAFSPFVGMFIARISSGRPIREFIVVTILAPSLIFATAFPFTVILLMMMYSLFQSLRSAHREIEENIGL